MTVAKGLGGGLPVGACVASPDASDVLEPGDHGSTFAGGPVIAAAAHAVLDVVTEDGLPRRRCARAASGSRTGSRGLGLEPRGPRPDARLRPADAQDVARRLLLEQRLVVHATGPDRIRLLPPLTVSDDEIDEAVRRLGAGASVGSARRWPTSATR